MKRPVTVSIAGQRYTLRSDEDEKTLHELAALVDRRFRETQKQTRTADTVTLAMLTALQLAEELMTERRSTAELKRSIKEKSQSLLRFLEREARV
jgi:cell division protein ZapA